MNIREARETFSQWHGHKPTLADMENVVRRRPGAVPLDLSHIHPDFGAEIDAAAAKYGYSRDAIMMAMLLRVGLAAGRFTEVDPGSGWKKLKPNACTGFVAVSGSGKTSFGGHIDDHTIIKLQGWIDDLNAKNMEQVIQEARDRDDKVSMTSLRMLKQEQKWKEPRCILNDFSMQALLGHLPNGAAMIEFKELREFWMEVQPKGFGKQDWTGKFCTLIDEYRLNQDRVGGAEVADRSNVEDASVSIWLMGQPAALGQFFDDVNIDSGFLGRFVLLAAEPGSKPESDVFEFEDYVPLDISRPDIFISIFNSTCEAGFKREALAGVSAGIHRTVYEYEGEAKELKRYSDGIFINLKRMFVNSEDFLYHTVKTKWVGKMPALADKYALLYQLCVDNSPIRDKHDSINRPHLISPAAIEFGFQIACLAYNNWCDFYADSGIDVEKMYKEAKLKAKSGRSVRPEVLDYARRLVEILGGLGPWTDQEVREAIDRLVDGDTATDRKRKSRIREYFAKESSVVRLEGGGALGVPKITFVL